MGDKIEKLYDFIQAEGGIPAKMRIAMQTGVPSNKAAATPDSDEVLAKFRAAIKDVIGKDAPAV